MLDNDKNLNLILATGAGGFGHPLAKKYKRNLEKGWPHIRSAVKKLNKIVVSSLTILGVPAESATPFYIDRSKINKITELLKAGKVPVFHADLIRDKQGKVFILSMDKFLADLAIFLKKKGYKIDKIIFAGTTPGVIDRKGKTIREITKKDFPLIKPVFYKGTGVDVSGGMRYKVEQSLRLAEYKIKALITKGLEKNSEGTLII
jgi:isopentenyl phosphate kinase